MTVCPVYLSPMLCWEVHSSGARWLYSPRLGAGNEANATHQVLQCRVPALLNTCWTSNGWLQSQMQVQGISKPTIVQHSPFLKPDVIFPQLWRQQDTHSLRKISAVAACPHTQVLSFLPICSLLTGLSGAQAQTTMAATHTLVTKSMGSVQCPNNTDPCLPPCP